jgi:hypothetical protein
MPKHTPTHTHTHYESAVLRRWTFVLVPLYDPFPPVRRPQRAVWRQQRSIYTHSSSHVLLHPISAPFPVPEQTTAALLTSNPARPRIYIYTSRILLKSPLHPVYIYIYRTDDAADVDCNSASPSVELDRGGAAVYIYIYVCVCVYYMPYYIGALRCLQIPIFKVRLIPT